MGLVGLNLAEMLHEKGARLTIADLDPVINVDKAAKMLDAYIVSPDKIFEVAV